MFSEPKKRFTEWSGDISIRVTKSHSCSAAYRIKFDSGRHLASAGFDVHKCTCSRYIRFCIKMVFRVSRASLKRIQDDFTVPLLYKLDERDRKRLARR